VGRHHDEIGAFWRGFETLWLPASLLPSDQQQLLADALYAASRHWSFEIQFDKGLAGAPEDALAASRDTATNPAVLTAFGLALIGSFGPPAYPGIPSYAPNLTEARGHATMIANAMGELRKVAPEPAAYRPLNWLTASRVLPRAAGWTAATLCHGSLLWSPFRVPGGRVAVPARGENRAPPTGTPFENQQRLSG
jgi:hypothetical protein